MSEWRDAGVLLQSHRISATKEETEVVQAFIDALARSGYRLKIEPKPTSVYYSWLNNLTSWLKYRLSDLTIDQLYGFKACDFMKLRRIGERRANEIIYKRTAFIRSHPELFDGGKPKISEPS